MYSSGYMYIIHVLSFSTSMVINNKKKNQTEIGTSKAIKVENL